MTGMVTVLPADETIVVSHDETLLQAAKRQGWTWPTVCQGDMECGICWVVVKEGADRLNQLRPGERNRLDMGMAAAQPTARLACQARVLESESMPIVVWRKGAKPRPSSDDDTGPSIP